jgi:ABC-type multidrug transport system fused ATPase/permease subunit
MSDSSQMVNITNLGLSWSSITFSSILIIAIIMSVVWTLLLVYLWPMYINVDEDNNLRFYYPFTCSYWSQRNEPALNVQINPEIDVLKEDVKTNLLNSSENKQSEDALQNEEMELVRNGDVEAPRGDESADRLQITNLTKKFGKFCAVDNLSLTMFKDQILVLLGHNGAGKTTTINMLIG